MEKRFCPYCGKPLEDECECERVAAESYELWVEELEERQLNSELYTVQDLMDLYRFER